MAENLGEHLAAVSLAVGALGAASYGIVDGLKLVPWIDLAGFEKLFSGQTAVGGRRWVTRSASSLDALYPALEMAYGADVMALLKAQYRNGRIKGDLPRTLRQGVRIGLGMMPADVVAGMAVALGLPGDIARRVAGALEQARALRPPATGENMPAAPVAIGDEDRSAIARFENAIDARIDAALFLADGQYVAQTKLLSTLVALIIALAVGKSMGVDTAVCFLVGVAAVPLAPVAKDLATALQSAVKAFRGR